MDELIRCSKSGKVRTVALCLALLCLSSLAWAGELPRYVRLTILHTNDVHGHFMPFNYLGEKNVGGIARRATMIDNIRAELPGSVIVMDAGDIFNNGPLMPEYKGFPDFAALNAVPYDIITLGNNEFSGAGGMEGQNLMRQRIKQAHFAVVAANVVEKSTGKTLVPSYKVFDISGVKVGVFGMTAPRVAGYSQAEGLSILDPIETARELVAELKDHVDVIIALTHIGSGMDENIGYDKKLAESVPEIDVIVGGDSHTWLREPVLVKKDDQQRAFWVGGPVVVQDGDWGHSLGRLDLILRRSGEHDYQVMSYKGRLIPVTSQIPARPDVEKLLAKYVTPYQKFIGKADRDMVDGELDKWVVGLMMKKTGTQVGFMDNWTVAGSLSAGPVSMFDIQSLLAFRNEVVKINVTGEQLKAAVKLLKNGDSAVLVGATITPEGSLLVDGKEIESSDTINVATSGFDAGLEPFKGVKPQSAGVNLVDLIYEELKN